MAYIKTPWKDRQVERPNTFRIQNNPDGTVTLIPIPGRIIEPGIAISASNFNKIEDAIVQLDSSLAESTNLITTYGGNSDGATPNDTAFNNAKVKGKVYFPQNSNNNATYYFTSVPDLTGVDIDCDKGVIISLPHTNGVSFKNYTIKNSIKIISRDRNNTGTLEKNNYDKGLYVSGNFSHTFEVENPKVLDTTSFEYLQLNITSTAQYLTAGAITKTGSMFNYDTSKIANYGLTYVGGIDFTPIAGKTYGGVFKVDDIESLNLNATDQGNIRVCIGVIPKNSGGSVDYNRFKLFSIKMNGEMWSGENLASSPYWTESKIDTASTNAYKLAKNNASLIAYARVIDSKTTEIYINGMYVTTIKNTTYDTAKLFFGHIQYTSQQLSKCHFGDFVECDVKKGNWGKALNIALFSDSIGYGEGCSIGWAEHLKNILAGRRGINRVFIQNFAQSGETSSQQLNRIIGSTLTGHDILLCVIGTNDIQTGVDIATFKTNIQSIIDNAKSKVGKVILGIPPMWISASEAGYGFQNLNSYAGGIYRSAILYVASQNNVRVVDLMSNFGEIDQYNEILRDTLHPQTWGELVISNAFANAILKEICIDI